MYSTYVAMYCYVKAFYFRFETAIDLASLTVKELDASLGKVNT